MIPSPEMKQSETRRGAFDEKTITYSGDELKRLLDELATRTKPDEETVEYPLSPEEINELLAADERALG